MPPQPSPLSTPLSPLANILAGRAAAASVPAPLAPALASTASISPTLPSSRASAATRPTATPTLVPPSQRPPSQRARTEITHTGGETAQELYEQLQRTVKVFRNAFVEIAYICHKLHEMGDWQQLGYTDEAACFSALHLAGSWETYVLLGQRLSHLTLEEMRGLTAKAAQLLTKIPPKLWQEYAWVEEARLLPARAFAELVQQRLGELSLSKKGLAEPKAALSLPVPFTLLAPLERRFDLIRRQQHLKTPAEALDFVLRMAEQGPGVVTATEKLDQCAGELTRWVEGEDKLEVERADMARLLNRMLRCVKELKKYANGLSTEVPAEGPARTGHTPLG